MSDMIRSLAWPGRADEDVQRDREWIVTNGLGGYASGTVSGVVTRRFHGPLIAALPSPFGRWMMLNALTECLHVGDRSVFLVDHPDALREFRLECGLPVWVYESTAFRSRSGFSFRTDRTPLASCTSWSADPVPCGSTCVRLSTSALTKAC